MKLLFKAFFVISWDANSTITFISHINFNEINCKLLELKHEGAHMMSTVLRSEAAKQVLFTSYLDLPSVPFFIVHVTFLEPLLKYRCLVWHFPLLLCLNDKEILSTNRHSKSSSTTLHFSSSDAKLTVCKKLYSKGFSKIITNQIVLHFCSFHEAY